MSADNLWLIRERSGRFYVTMEFASMLLEGFHPPEPEGDALFFETERRARQWCRTEDAECVLGPTEYGIVLETELPQLAAIKAREQEAMREAIREALRADQAYR